MRRLGLGVAWCMVSAAVAFAQDAGQHSGKAGLWEVTTTMTWQKSPVPPGSPGGPPGAGTHTTSVCLTQAMVDAGALFPQSRGQCKIANKVIKPGSVTADYVCTGKMKGKGILEVTFSDLEHTSGSLHFQGTLDVGPQTKPIEWTTVSTSVLKSEQCPSDQPQAPATPKPSK
jgi:hypothetical protein